MMTPKIRSRYNLERLYALEDEEEMYNEFAYP